MLASAAVIIRRHCADAHCVSGVRNSIAVARLTRVASAERDGALATRLALESFRSAVVRFHATCGAGRAKYTHSVARCAPAARNALRARVHNATHRVGRAFFALRLTLTRLDVS